MQRIASLALFAGMTCIGGAAAGAGVSFAAAGAAVAALAGVLLRMHQRRTEF